MTRSDKQQLHIVSFDVPYPPDYGGVVDVWNRIVALNKVGFTITLHCFDYGRGRQNKLLEHCKEVYYYKRSPLWYGLLSKNPLIVQSRKNPTLLKRLQQDQHPILLEGLHCCAWLAEQKLDDRTVLLRMHNDEADYYKSLAKREKNWFSRMYFTLEARRLKTFEETMKKATRVIFIAPSEYEKFSVELTSGVYLPPFHGNTSVNSHTGKGNYIMYHGNLSVNENDEAATYLTREVFSKINHPVIIAGKSPSSLLQNLVNRYDHIELVANPSDTHLKQLIEDAHIHSLITFQATGMKLKLLRCLFNGRFCLVNTPMVNKTQLAQACITADRPQEMIEKINELISETFNTADINKRTELLQSFNDNKNALMIAELLNQASQPEHSH